MSLSLRSLKNRLIRRFVRLNVGRLRAVQTFLDVTDERYLDADLWAKMRGVSVDEALRQLETGVKMQLLEKCFLYEWSDAQHPEFLLRDIRQRNPQPDVLRSLGRQKSRDELIVVIEKALQIREKQIAK